MASLGANSTIVQDNPCIIFSSLNYVNVDVPITQVEDTSAPAPDVEKYIPISTVAAKVIANADAGHSPSKDLVRSVATADFNAGALDSDLEANAKPLTDATDPSDPSVPFDPSSIISAIQSLKSTIDNLVKDIKEKFNTLAVSLGVIEAKVDNVAAEQQRTMQVINDGMAT